MTRRDLTAMSRTDASRPLRLALEQKIITKSTSVLDYGCGRGADVAYLKARGINCRGWDPVFCPHTRRTSVDVVTLNYVLNVIDDLDERHKTLMHAWKLTKSTLVVAVRLQDERDESHVIPRGDGWMTPRGTFQKFFEHDEIRFWLSEITGTNPITAGPGVFLMFKKVGERERFIARRYAVRIPKPQIRKSDHLYVEHRSKLEPLIDFYFHHGRLPKPAEIENSEEIVSTFGSVRRAFRVIEIVTDRQEWVNIADKRRIDVLVFLALRQLEGTFKLSELDKLIQADVRAHHRSFASAMDTATRLLYSAGKPDALNIAARSSAVGKLTPSALYLHADAMVSAPALLKVYEGCARRVTGELPEANIVKLHRDSLRVSYLSYPTFDTDPHPAISASTVVDLRTLKFKRYIYRSESNLPILHRKETFLNKTDPRYDIFAELTKAEVEAGLYANPSEIGYRDQWEQRLKDASLRIEGHRLLEGSNGTPIKQS